MPKGILKISTELLMQMLQLDGYKVKAARFHTFTDTVIEVIVEHDSIPEAKENTIPEVYPTYKSYHCPVLDKVEFREYREL